MTWLKETPWWVFAVCLGLASIEPVTHVALEQIHSEQAVHSGLHTPDSAIYLACMRMLENDFFSPYATCTSPNGPHDPAFLPTPFHWLYAVVGEIGRWFWIGEFVFLGLANGFFGLVYLLVVYHFLRAAAGSVADLAFVLWALGGGLGGALYLVAMLTGAASSAGFEASSFRFVMYELIEGPGLFPILHIPRLYYTVSLALGFGALTAFINGLGTGCRWHLVFAGLLLFGSAVVNIRFGAFAWSVAVMYLVCRVDLTARRQAALAVAMFVPVAAAAAVFAAMQWTRPVFTETALAIVRESIWPTGFLTAAIFYLPLLVVAGRAAIPALPRLPRGLAAGAVGYLVALIPLFLAYQFYYGSLWRGGDHAALARVSDFALVGGVVGLAAGWRRKSDQPGLGTRPATGTEWFVLWALVFLAAGMSALGQGWGVRLVPQRFLAMLGVPLAVSAAVALRAWAAQRPVGTRVYAGAVVSAGLLSIAVGSAFFQAPVGRIPSDPTYAERHPELISPADAALLDKLEAGVVLAPPEIADAVAMRPGVRVLGGIGATDLSDAPSVDLDRLFGRFYAEHTTDHGTAHRLLDDWCVDYVLFPDTRRGGWPAWHPDWRCDRLDTTAAAGAGRLMRVNQRAAEINRP